MREEEVFMLGDDAYRVEVTLVLPSNELTFAPHTAFQVEEMGGVMALLSSCWTWY